jgi:UDP-glucose 4-epimerase
MDNILITGGAGYVGSHAVKYFLQKGYKVVVIDNLETGFQGAIEVLKSYGDLTHCNVDLRNFEEVNKVFESNKFDVVLHFAALASVFDCLKKPYDYFTVDAFGTLNLLNACQLHQVKKFIFSSTCAVMGESKYLPMDEMHSTEPTSPYGEAKLMAEKMLAWYTKIYGIKYVAFRYFNVCGASEDGKLGDSQNPSTHLMQNVVRGALGIEPFKMTCPKVDTPDGTPIRDYVDISDLIEAHFLAYEYLSKGGESEKFNLGNGEGYSVLEIVSKVEEIMGVTVPRDQGESRSGEYAKVYASHEKAEKLLGWKPTRSLQDSVESLKNWYTKNPHGFISN